jgi:hypothetical protein
MDYSKEPKNQMRNRILFWKWRTGSNQIKQENQNYLKGIYTQIEGIYSIKFRIPVSGDY